MKAMVLNKTGRIEDNKAPLCLEDRPNPSPDNGHILIKVLTCGVCHTELDEIEGRSSPTRLPVIPGHQVAHEQLL